MVLESNRKTTFDEECGIGGEVDRLSPPKGEKDDYPKAN